MAGSQDPNENPVAINVVPMVDVIFCLCVFFMCSFKFKQIEGKFDSWLPKDKGVGAAASTTDLIQEIRVMVSWDDATQTTRRQFGTKVMKSDDELQASIRSAHGDFIKLGNNDVPVTIDSDARVPWKEIINVMNLCKREQIDKIEFAFGAAK